MKKQKRPLTLLEILISFVLASFIIGALLFSLKTSVQVNAKTQQAKSDILSRGAVQQRLDALLFHLAPSAPAKPNSPVKTSLFLEDDKGKMELHFFFDQGVDPEPAFCGNLEGILGLGLNHTLCLTLTSQKTGESRKEILMDSVEDLFFAFLSQDDKGTFQETQEWKSEGSFPPQAIKMTAQIPPSKKLEFVFWLPLHPKPILYHEGTSS